MKRYIKAYGYTMLIQVIFCVIFGASLQVISVMWPEINLFYPVPISFALATVFTAPVTWSVYGELTS